MKRPKISIIMPVYNVDNSFLCEAIDSILQQTYTDYEFLIINDATSDENLSVIRSYTDQRIKLVNNPVNYGITKSLNVGLRYAQGDYIARMDADDISLPDRLEAQYYFMERHKDISVLGGCVKILGTDIVLGTSYNLNKEVRRIRMSFRNEGIIHPTAFIRKEFLDKHKLEYDECILKAQDYELWSRCIEYGVIEVLPKIVLKYRVHEKQISTAGKQSQNQFNDIIKIRALNKLGHVFSENDEKKYLDFTNYGNQYSLTEYSELISKLRKQNCQLSVYQKSLYISELRLILMKHFFTRRGKVINFFTNRSIRELFYPSTIAYYVYWSLKTRFNIIRVNRSRWK